MKKRVLTILLSAAMAVTMVVPANTVGVQADETGAVTVKAKDAVLDGVQLKDTDAELAISYDSDHDAIIGIGEYATATYTIPDGTTAGEYDVYLEVSKASSAFVSGSTPIYVSVNGGEETVPPVPVEPCTMAQMGLTGSPASYMDDMGVFIVKTSVYLEAGDVVKIGGVAGNEFKYNGTYMTSLPAIGDLTIYPAGTEVTQGYADTDRVFVDTTAEKDASDPLSGLKIAWLGSSVTYGAQANGHSMADAIQEKHAGTICDKFAISGTTLASCKYSASVPTDGEGSHGSYVERIKQIDKDADYDLFIVQLSTNDATNGIPMGELARGFKYSEFNKATVIGAMEYIVKYAKDTWGCPVMFYTGSKYDSTQYQEMVDAVLAIQEKWGIGVVDLWNNDEINNISTELKNTYIKEDGIHPTRDGYDKWWTPAFEEEMTEYLIKTGTVAKMTQSLTVTPASKAITLASLKKSSASVSIAVSGAQGTVSYKSNSKYITVNAKGVATVKKNTPAGTYTITVTVKATDLYAAASKTVTIKVTKYAQSLKVSPASKTVKSSSIKKKSASFSITVKRAKGKVTYSSSSKYVTVSAKGKVTIKKKAPVGTYKITVHSKATSSYYAAEKTVTIKVTK